MLTSVCSFNSLRNSYVSRCLRANFCKAFSNLNSVDKNNNIDYKTAVIVLTPEEKQFFETLSDFVREKRLGTTVRVAGGWVRDKLLGDNASGKSTSEVDIDIALDNITGTRFVEKLNQWYYEKGLQFLRYNIIKQNPDKSKHLETVHLAFGNFLADLVNLRTESYCNTSRIPRVNIGTAREDAYRRDLTINTLFYNINTSSIEDLTGMGLQDLQEKIVRTPLPPLVTLTDDPLRALRTIRFACRFNFAISLDLLQACHDITVISSLLEKVSRERILQEIELMSKTKYFTRALYLFYSTGMYKALVSLPIEVQIGKYLIYHPERSPLVEDKIIPLHKIQHFHKKGMLGVLLFQYMAQQESWQYPSCNQMKSAVDEIKSEDTQFSLLFALLTIELGGLSAHLPDSKSKSMLCGSILRNTLKMSQKQCHDISVLVDNAEYFLPLLEAVIVTTPLAIQSKTTEFTLLTHFRTDKNSLLEMGLWAPKWSGVNGLELGLCIDNAKGKYRQAILVACIKLAIKRFLALVPPPSLPIPTADSKNATKSSSNKNNKNKSTNSSKDQSETSTEEPDDTIAIEMIERMIMELTQQCHIDKQGGRVEMNDSSSPSDTKINKSSMLKKLLKELENALKQGNALLDVVDHLQFNNIWEKPFLLNGHEIKQLAGVEGEMIGKLVATQREWMLCHHPQGDIENLKNYLLDVLKIQAKEERAIAENAGMKAKKTNRPDENKNTAEMASPTVVTPRKKEKKQI